jgi:hypothetical protein
MPFNFNKSDRGLRFYKKLLIIVISVKERLLFVKESRQDLYCTPQILKALCLDVLILGIFRAPIEVIVIHFRL